MLLPPLFQFLIGTLKTRLGGPGVAEDVDVSIPDRYAKNIEALRMLSVAKLFQFLIGTLKTGLRDPVRKRWSLVSIPDRYAKNI